MSISFETLLDGYGPADSSQVEYGGVAHVRRVELCQFTCAFSRDGKNTATQAFVPSARNPSNIQDQSGQVFLASISANENGINTNTTNAADAENVGSTCGGSCGARCSCGDDIRRGLMSSCPPCRWTRWRVRLWGHDRGYLWIFCVCKLVCSNLLPVLGWILLPQPLQMICSVLDPCSCVASLGAVYVFRSQISFSERLQVSLASRSRNKWLLIYFPTPGRWDIGKDFSGQIYCGRNSNSARLLFESARATATRLNAVWSTAANPATNGKF